MHDYDGLNDDNADADADVGEAEVEVGRRRTRMVIMCVPRSLRYSREGRCQCSDGTLEREGPVVGISAVAD